jgi:signal transduction histidine kinase/CheY-like chemotaxis protein
MIDRTNASPDSGDLDRAVLRRFRRAAYVCLGAGILIALLVLTGWVLHITALRDLFSHAGLAGAMAPTTAFLIVVLGHGLLARFLGRDRWAMAIGVFVALWGSAKIVQFIAGMPPTPDPQVLWLLGWPDVVDYMAFNAAVALTCLGCAVCLAAAMGKDAVAMIAAQLLTLAGGGLGFYALLGYSLKLPTLLFLGGTDVPMFFIAWPAALAFSFFGAAFLAAEVDKGFMKVFAGTGLSGLFARRLIPVMVVLPNVLASIGEWARGYGWLSHQGTVLWLVCSITTIASIVLLKAVADMGRFERIGLAKSRELAQSNACLQEAKEAADAANRAKSRFLANMSHEIRTPMTAVLGYTDLLMDSAVSDSKRRDYLAMIHRNGEYLLGLINDILDLSKIEAGKLSIEMRRCKPATLVAEIANALRPRAAVRGISLDFEQAEDLPEFILTDAERFRQIVINLAGNAIKFTKQGGVRIVASYIPEWRDGNPAVHIAVIDTGIGIRDEVLRNLFQPFVQGDNAVSREFGGTGLGLAISRQLAELLGGTLTARSVFGQGSCFALTLPVGDLHLDETPPEPADAEQEKILAMLAAPKPDLTGIRVLVAEDGIDNRELIEVVLQNAGATVATAENGRLAVALAETNPFDIILMDMNMPEMDGEEATRLLRSRGCEIPILALTASTMLGDRERCLAAGCDEYLSKPINRPLMLQMIAHSVGRKATATATSH